MREDPLPSDREDAELGALPRGALQPDEDDEPRALRRGRVSVRNAARK